VTVSDVVVVAGKTWRWTVVDAGVKFMSPGYDTVTV